jgi:hypothetical protein
MEMRDGGERGRRGGREKEKRRTKKEGMEVSALSSLSSSISLCLSPPSLSSRLLTPLSPLFDPRCGHCKQLAPEYAKAATALKGVVKMAAVDMTQHQELGSPYNVRGFPTIKVFAGNKKSPTDYNGARRLSRWLCSFVAAPSLRAPTHSSSCHVACP